LPTASADSNQRSTGSRNHLAKYAMRESPLLDVDFLAGTLVPFSDSNAVIAAVMRSRCARRSMRICTVSILAPSPVLGNSANGLDALVV
jgi:hypothetical protein